MFNPSSASHMPSRCGSRQGDAFDAKNSAVFVNAGHAAAACLILFAGVFGAAVSLLLALTGLLGSLIRLIISGATGAQLQMSHL